MLMTVQDDGVASHTMAELQQRNQAQQEAETLATPVEQPPHEPASTEHRAANGEKQQENQARQEPETSATPVEQPPHEPASTEHVAASGEKQQKNQAQQEAEAPATPVEQPQHEPASIEHRAANGEKQQENQARQEPETSATPVEQPPHEPASTEHVAASGEKQQKNQAQQEAETPATPVEQPQHEPASKEHGAASGEKHQENQAQQKAETSETFQTASSAPTEAEDGQRRTEPPVSRELALERQLADMQLELARLKAFQTARKGETGNHGSNSDSDVEIVSIIHPSAKKRTLAQTRHLVKNEAASPTSKRCKQELQESSERATIKKESSDKESGAGSNEVSPTECGEGKPTDESVIIKHESPEKKSEPSRTEPIQTEEQETNPAELVACIMLQDNSWQRLVTGKENTLIRSYNLRKMPMELQVLVMQDGSRCVYAGRFTIASTKPVTAVYSISNADDRKVWADRILAGKTVITWTVSELVEIDNPVQVRFPSGKFKPRHFFCSREQLGQGFTIDVPPPSLFETPNFFLSLLSPQRRDHLEGIARTLHGRTLRVGTACSGTDICLVALKGLISMMNKVFNAFRQHSAIHTYINYCHILSHINIIYNIVNIYIFMFDTYIYIRFYITIYTYIYLMITYLYIYIYIYILVNFWPAT